MRENNKTCICCGKKYTYCPSCSEFDKYPKWMNIYHDENCREIFMVTSDFIAGDIVKDEAKARLDKCDLSKMSTFHATIQKAINDIYGSDGLLEKQTSNGQKPKMVKRTKNTEE